ncbi:MAG: hypothetical protein E7638_00085 [Ruminococcaceae bacterium]|nr:hypothetical protein [Oscillospiraceae bacterium]
MKNTLLKKTICAASSVLMLTLTSCSLDADKVDAGLTWLNDISKVYTETVSTMDSPENAAQEAISPTMWNKLSSGTYFLDVCKPYDSCCGYSCSLRVYYAADATAFLMAGDEYTNGLVLSGWNEGVSFALFNLEGKYKSLEMVIAPVDGSRGPSDIAFVVDDVIVAKYTVEDSDYPKTISVPLKNGNQLMIRTLENCGNACTGLGNIIVK